MKILQNPSKDLDDGGVGSGEGCACLAALTLSARGILCNLVHLGVGGLQSAEPCRHESTWLNRHPVPCPLTPLRQTAHCTMPACW